jgi:hypothetical protein
VATAPDEDIANHIASGGLGRVLGTNLFTGPERAVSDQVPADCIFVLASGGFPPAPYLDNSGQDDVLSTVQITIRSAPNDYSGGRSTARSVRNRVHKGSIAGYVDVRVREAEPNYIGQDEAASHLHTVNVELRHRR